MSARLPQLDNGCAAGNPVAGPLLTPANKGKERVRPKTSPNDQSADPVGDIEQTVDAFDFRRLFQQDCAVQTPFKHSPPLHSLESEQWKGAATSGESKAVTRIDQRFRPTVDSLRRAVSVTFDSGTPANDNDNFDPLEAA